MTTPTLFAIILVALLAACVVAALWLARKQRSTSSQSTHLVQTTEASTDEAPDAIIFGEPDAPLITIAREAPAALASYGAPLPERQRLALAPLLQHAPLIAVNAANAGSNLYRVSFDPEVQKLIAQGHVRFMEAIGGGARGIAVDAAGKTRGHARLFSNNGLRVANIAAASWQVLAVVTAQKYLLDINRKLGAIQTNLDEIKQWLELEKVAVLTNSLGYVRSVHDACLRGEFTEHDVTLFGQQLEDSWVQCGAVAETFRLALATFPKRFAEIDLVGFFSVAGAITTANSCIAEYERLAQAHTLACYTRTAIVEARSALPMPTATAGERIKELRSTLMALSDSHNAFFDGVEQRVRDTMEVVFSRASTTQSYRSQVLTEATAAQTRLQNLTSEVREAIASTQERVQRERQVLPTTILVELDAAGQVSSAHQLPATTH